MSCSDAPSHNLFVYGSILEPAVAAVILDRPADTVPALLHGYHKYKLKGRPYPCIVPFESGKVNGKVITGVSDAELNKFDVTEGSEYERVTVEVVRMDNSEKMKVETYVWVNKDDPSMYGEWDYEEWRVIHADKFVEAFREVLEWNKNPNGKTREDIVKSLGKRKMSSSDQSPSHNVFVYGSFQEPAVVGLILECTPVIVSAQLHGFHRYRLKGRLHPCIAPLETGVIDGKVLTGLTDAHLENLDMIEGDEYVRKTVEVLLTDTSGKMQVEAFIWANKDDPDMYGEWDFEEWKLLHMEKFIEASEKFIEWKKNPDGRSREEFAKFVEEDPPFRGKKMATSEQSPSYNVFVYGSFQEPAVVSLILEFTPVIVSAQLHGFHLYRLKGRLHPCISPFESGLVNGKVLTGLTEAQLKNLDMIQGAEYVRKTVEVVLTETSEKMEVEALIWANMDDPDMYGEWDFEEWKRLHMDKFIEASKKFIEWKKNPDSKTREEFEKFVHEDPPVATNSLSLSLSHSRTMTSSNQSPSHNVFVYGSFQEPSVVNLILECDPVTISAQLHGYHLYRLKGRLHPCISPSENGLINGKILTGLTDAQLENLDMIEGDEYVRKTVEVVLTETSEKMQVETFVWANKDDPHLYGEWDFEEWKKLHMEKFIEASKKFIEWKKNPDGRSREEFVKFVEEDITAA
ncbi:unnamed protein product [Brassica rapa subsp. narinosa]